MGIVFSCFASTFMWTGELLENVFIAIGEIGSVLVRGVFSLLVGFCDVLAAISCCCNVPWSQRPDRTSYDFHTTSANIGRGGVYNSYLTTSGREARQQQKAAAKKEQELRAEAARAQKEETKAQKAKWAQEKKDAAQKVKEAAAKEKEAKAAAAK